MATYYCKWLRNGTCNDSEQRSHLHRHQHSSIATSIATIGFLSVTLHSHLTPELCPCLRCRLVSENRIPLSPSIAVATATSGSIKVTPSITIALVTTPPGDVDLLLEKNPKIKEAITQNFTEYLRCIEEIRCTAQDQAQGQQRQQRRSRAGQAPGRVQLHHQKGEAQREVDRHHEVGEHQAGFVGGCDFACEVPSVLHWWVVSSADADIPRMNLGFQLTLPEPPIIKTIKSEDDADAPRR
ncbi:hypothetical protein Fmac_024964 [Flemingia macrophylla]|uniref:Uncharacterized protein n=1 Tax=Flemingia macrophylla TaxID=520843 RepID=A0ABD1LQV5_9FABA